MTYELAMFYESQGFVNDSGVDFVDYEELSYLIEKYFTWGIPKINTQE